MNIENVASDFNLENTILNFDLLQKALELINYKSSTNHKQRESDIIVKRFFENKTYKDIAEEYNVTIEVIRTNERRGLNRMRWALSHLMSA